MKAPKRLTVDFYTRDVLEVAPELIGKILVRRLPTGEELRYRITETEAYRGEEDTGCHAKAGRTNRTIVMYGRGGHAYIYLCYGIHHLINAVTGKEGQPQAALLRGVEGYYGPARLTKAMQITKELNNIDLTTSDEIWIEDDGTKPEYVTGKRIGIDYADEHYRNIEWRFTAPSEIKQKKTVKVKAKAKVKAAETKTAAKTKTRAETKTAVKTKATAETKTAAKMKVAAETKAVIKAESNQSKRQSSKNSNEMK